METTAIVSDRPMAIAQPLTVSTIRALLTAVAQGHGDPVTYQRLLEIYCVVRGGGVQAQVAAAQHFAAQERQDLSAQQQALAQQPPSPAVTQQQKLLTQEAWELEQSLGDRLAHLHSIRPEEEVAVRQCWEEIEAHWIRE